MSEPRTHYQISLTARQAVGLFAGLLLAIGLAFFFGLMAGLSGRDRNGTETVADFGEAPQVAKTPADAPPPVETGIPSGDSSTAAAAPSPVPGEATPPATLRTFQDSADEEQAAPPNDSGSRTTIAGAKPPPIASAASAAKAPPAAARPPASGGADRVWVQAASLSSHDEANALGARLNRHGFHAVVLAGTGPKGRIYRVRVGPYRSEEEASRAVAKLTRQERIREPWIVPDGR